MIEESTLQLVAKLMSSSEREMARLGEEIFINSIPSSEDIDALNNLHGYAPIMNTHQDIQISTMLKDADKHVDLFENLNEYKPYPSNLNIGR